MPGTKKAKTKNPKSKKTTVRSARSVAGRIAFVALVVAAVLALGIFLVLRDGENISAAENGIGSVLQPVWNVTSRVTGALRDAVKGLRDYATMSENYQVVLKENATLKLQLQALEETQIENIRLSELLDAKDAYSDADPVFARVIGRDPGVWFDTFTIDRGEKDGLAVNMAVMNGDGLIGRIYEIGYNYAKVLSVIDTRSSVACLIERTRDNGVMRGGISATSESSECNMYYLPRVNDIVPGDVVLTSGVDGLYPKGLIVGTVQAVTRQSDLSDQYIVVTPAVDFLRLEEVLVLQQSGQDVEGSHHALYTPTPRPTVSPTPGPQDEIAPEATPQDPNEQQWRRPSATPDELPGQDTEDGEEPESTPAPTHDPSSMQPEDEWTM